MKMIPLSQGKFAIVDDKDYEALARFKWHVCRIVLKNRIHWSAVRNIHIKPDRKRRTRLYMHQQILDIGQGALIDHKNTNALDNRRGNLRLATYSRNMQNSLKRSGTSSRFKGVCWDKENGKWMSTITISRHHKTLGRFTDEQAAADAYDEAAIRYFGEFALTNEQLNRA